MRTTTNQFRSGAAALAFMALAVVVVTTFSACQSTEEGLDAHPQGSIPLVVGTVTVGTPATVGTRVAITEGATGHTGIRKSRFVAGNQIELQVSDASGGSSHTITLDGKGNWNFDRPAYVLPNSTMTATYYPAEQQAGIPADNLSATTDPDGGITLTGGTLTLGLKHVGAMIDVTPVSGGAAITSVTLNDNIATVAEEEAAQAVHYRTIVAAGSTAISTITAEINGIKYVATLATPITPGANKCHPINLTFKNGTLTATANAPQNWTDGGVIKPGAPNLSTGYNRIINSPEALAQYAKDANDNAGGVARNFKVVQTANIDMSQLKPLAEAGNNPNNGSPYTYTATADNWVPIGTQSNAFTGSYNGNGFTISNMEITTYPTDYQGFFGYVGSGAQLTGIHLRDFKAVESAETFATYAGALVGSVENSTISLCSATGKLEGKAGQYSQIGGLIGSSEISCITRCTSRVNVTVTLTEVYSKIGGFAGALSGAVAVSCSSVSDLSVDGDGYVGGFCGNPYSSAESNTIILGCYAGGTIVGSNGGAFCGNIDNSFKITLESCYSDVTGDNISDFIGSTTSGFDRHTISDCAWAGANQSPNVPSITYGIAPAAAYAAVTANDVNSTNVKTLHWSAADGYTLTSIDDKTWNATGIWKNNLGALPTINLAYEGE